MAPDQATINDYNAALINIYKQLRDNKDEVIELLDSLDNNWTEDKKAYYNLLRSTFNEKKLREEMDTELAALFLFLNKHCFNGHYRENKKGEFNASYNKSTRRS